MKTPSRLAGCFAALLALAFYTANFTPLTAAEPAPAKGVEPKKGKHKAAGNTASEADLLRDAYGILERADHDYKGHRRAAMHDIEEAAKHLGVKLHGDGKGREQQSVSDEQLREARGMLEKAQGMTAGHKNKKVPEHIAAAVKKLGVALSIK